MEVQLPKDYICKCQCAVKLIITYPAEACTVAGPYPMVMFTSGFQVKSYGIHSVLGTKGEQGDPHGPSFCGAD